MRKLPLLAAMAALVCAVARLLAVAPASPPSATAQIAPSAPTPSPAPAFHAWAQKPPMGWNSWDCFATTVTETQTKQQADYMAAHLKPHGWEYIVVDIQWYEPAATGFNYRKGAPLILDPHGRLLPAVNKFPSAADGAGFKPLADYVHSLGLKFGIHLMRGIPRQAVAENLPVLGTNVRAADIANVNSVCTWNTDMYGVDMSKPGAQEYYDSVFALIASWGVDYVKVDDLSRPYHDNEKEVEAIRRAIDKTGRPMVLSLSPGETALTAAAHVTQHANLWRISDDFWDKWPELFAQFARLENWNPHRTPGAWPDADMLPFGVIDMGKRSTNFSRDEQVTVMTLWSIARSPLMHGGDMTKMDPWTLSLLTNDEVLAVNQRSTNNRPLFNRENLIAWTADATGSPDKYLALFNATDVPARVPVALSELGFTGPVVIRDLWSHTEETFSKAEFAPKLSSHGAGLYRISSAAPFPVAITVDAATPRGALKPIWRYFGADEPNYATMKDGQKLLAQLGELAPGHIYFRAHNLLTSGDGTPALKWGSTNAYTEDAAGNPIYDWRGIDRIFDSYRERGVKPLVQIGFMPEALSTEPTPYRHSWRPGLPYEQIYTGWTKPPKDYAKWGELAYQWAKHSVEKYGAAEVGTWWWEVWNEANNNPKGYWGASSEEFRKLHDYAIAGVRRAFPQARVGGPHSASHGGQFMKDFLEHCLRGTNYATGEKGTPLDYVSFHAKGSPTFVDGHVRMGIANQLRTIETAFNTIGSYPELKNTPIIIGESDPEGCAACQGPQMAYRNGTMYSSYTAASFARKHELAAVHGVNLEGAVTWAFTFEDQPYFAGFRQLASNGVPLPVLNVFRMFAKMGPTRVHATSTGEIPLGDIINDGVRGAPDVGVLAARDDAKKQLAALVWHYHDDDLAGPAAAVKLAFAGLPADAKDARVTHYRIDQTHSNAYAEWLRQGSPIAPNPKQYAALLRESELATLAAAPAEIAVAAGGANLEFNLPRQGVSLVLLEWK